VFSWDSRKALINLEKHGVSFEEAATVFADPEALEWEDTSHSKDEERMKRLGSSASGRILILVYTCGGLVMTKKRFGSSARVVRARKSGKHTSTEAIDFSDIPESTDVELRRARRVGRPRTGKAKQLIALRISPQLLAQLRRLAARQDKPYQTLIHDLLEKATSRKVA
jgi:uncharacterized DUF497 family protein